MLLRSAITKNISYLLVLLFINSAFADWTKIPSADFSVAPPPIEGSAEDVADIDTVLRLQDSRTKEQCDMGNKQKIPTYEAYFALKQIISEDEIQRIRPLMEPVLRFSMRVASYVKDQYTRQRPADRDSRVHPCIELRSESSTAYPSGHSTIGAAAACVLAELYPEHKTEFIDYGRLIGDLRVIGGVHHPSDVRAGAGLGNDICNRLLSESDFRDQLEEMRR